MKPIVKSTISLFIGALISSNFIFGQQVAPPPQPRQKPVLSEEQKAVIKLELQKRAEIREAFKASLTQEQKDMLTDPRMVPADRMKAFRASLSDQQVKAIRARQQEIKGTKKQLISKMSAGKKMRKILIRCSMNSC